MARNMSRVANGTKDGQPGERAALNRLRQRVRQITFFEIAASRNIDDANPIFRGVIEHPLQALLNLRFTDSSRVADFHQHDVRVRSDPAIEPSVELAVAGGDN